MVKQNSLNEWQDISLGEVLNYEQPTKYLVDSEEYDLSGTVPVLTAGKTFILGYTEELNGLFDNLPTILFDDFTTSSHFVDFKFKVKSSACKMLKTRSSSYNLKYIYYLMKQLTFEPYDHKRYWISEYSKIQVQVPEIKEQNLIAEALSDIDGFILNSRRLFSKKINVMDGLVGALVSGQYFKKIGAEFHFDSIKNLGVDVKKGELITEKTAIEGGVPVIAGGVSAAYYHNTPNRTGITVTISASGANAGYVNIWKQTIWASDCSTISESSVFDLRYLYYILKGNQENIYRSQYGGAQPHVRPNEIEKIVIPWTEKRNQKEIADLLDDFSNEIKNLETSIQKSELLKQGIMNDLLTGKVRLV